LESTAFSNRYSAASGEEEYYSCSATELKLRKKVKVLREMIPAAAAAARGSSQDIIMSSTTTDTSLVLDEAIHYVKLLQLHVQMLRTGGSKPKE
jgi:predicted ATPase with chaperone activity